MGSPKGRQSLRSSVGGMALQSMANPALPTSSDSREETPLNGMGWIGAGLLAGMILAVSAAPPASAQEVQPIGWTGPMGFTVKTAKHLELCKTTRSSTKGIRTKFTKKSRGRKNIHKVLQFGTDIRRKLQASRGVRKVTGSDSAVKSMDYHA